MLLFTVIAPKKLLVQEKMTIVFADCLLNLPNHSRTSLFMSYLFLVNLKITLTAVIAIAATINQPRAFCGLLCVITGPMLHS